MKKLLIYFPLFFCCHLYGQTNNVSDRIAQKMADSLGLTNTQRARILDINLQMQKSKADVRTKYGDVDSITKHFQRIENTRDSLYSEVIPGNKYKMYLQKKRNLVSAQ